MNIRQILVIGHNGFIGAYCMEYLEQHYPDIPVQGISFPELDLTDPASAQQLIPMISDTTAVLLLAGIKRQLGESLEIFQKNMRMIENLIPILEKTPPARLVYASSCAVFGEEMHNLSIDEDTPLHPQSYYGISKVAAEQLLDKLSREHNISTVCVRPPLVYGQGDTSNAYGPTRFVNQAVSGETITLWGDGTELREFLFVNDLAALMCQLLFVNYTGPLNAVSGESKNFKMILDALNNILPQNATINQRERSKDKVDNAFNADRLYSALPGFTFTSLHDGIDALIESISGQS